MYQAESSDTKIVMSIDPSSKNDIMSAASTAFTYIIMRDPTAVSQCCIYNFMSTLFIDDQKRAIESLVAGRAALFSSSLAQHAAKMVTEINKAAEMNSHREKITFTLTVEGELSCGY